jgi:hypothetical protein
MRTARLRRKEKLGVAADLFSRQRISLIREGPSLASSFHLCRVAAMALRTAAAL